MSFISVVFVGTLGLLNVLLGLVVRESILYAETRRRALHPDGGEDSLLTQLKVQSVVERIKCLEISLEQLQTSICEFTFDN
jgi:hypothetical protein